mmetsp:Transcript_24467/g.70226  ORF Transcript_24467/g.70226 Transcript_24467/m.70226 type:complete len:213 (-) Transcript_24467:834-1472(-)
MVVAIDPIPCASACALRVDAPLDGLPALTPFLIRVLALAKDLQGGSAILALALAICPDATCDALKVSLPPRACEAQVCQAFALATQVHVLHALPTRRQALWCANFSGKLGDISPLSAPHTFFALRLHQFDADRDRIEQGGARLLQGLRPRRLLRYEQLQDSRTGKASDGLRRVHLRFRCLRTHGGSRRTEILPVLALSAVQISIVRHPPGCV